jgi:hypothetical protein
MGSVVSLLPTSGTLGFQRLPPRGSTRARKQLAKLSLSTATRPSPSAASDEPMPELVDEKTSIFETLLILSQPSNAVLFARIHRRVRWQLLVRL